MPDYSRTRSEFMRIMSGGGETTGFSPDAINDVNDASFDAAALTQIMADNALRKPETQSAFDGSRPIGEASATEEQEQAGFGEFIGNVNHSVIEGFMNSVDALWDFGMDIVGGLFGGGWFGAENTLTDWTQSAIENDEWVDQSVRAMSAMGYVLTDDFWTNDNGFWTDWSHENTLALNEQHYNGQEWVRKVGNFAGEMIPQIALVVATQGQSLTVQLATQTAMGFSRQFGRSVEQAFNEGASYQQASAYGAASGAVEAAFSAISVGIGGFLASKGSQGIITRASQEVGKVFGKAFNSATLQTVAGKATEIILNAAEEGGEEVVAGLLDPVFRQIYDDQAIYNAYGTPENTKSYIASLGQAFLTAAAGAALMGVGREIGSFAGQGGWQGYSKNYLNEVQTSDNFRYLREYDREHGTSYSSDYVQSTYANQRIVQANEDLKADLERLKNEGASEAYIKEYGEYWQGQIKKMTSKYNETYSKVFEDASRILEQRNEAQSQKRGTGLGFSRPTDTEGEVTTHRAPSAEATAETVGEPETVAKPKVIRTIDDAGNSVSYVDATTAKQLSEALADNSADTPDTMRLPVKTDYSEDPIFVSRSSLSDAEKTRLSNLTSDDIKTEGIYDYADLSPDKILVFNEGKGGVYTVSSVDEETGSRHFNIDGPEIELPPAIQRIDNEPSSSDRAGSVDVPRTPLEEVQGKYGKNVSNNAPSLIREAANAKEGKIYALKRSKAMMNDIDDYVSDMLSSEGELSGRFKVKATDKAEITREVFAELNLSKDPDLTAKVRDYLNGRVFEQEVAYVDENGNVTERFKLGDLLDSEARSEVEGKLNEAFDELLSHGQTSRYQKLQSQIDRLIGEVTETRERARLIASAHKKVNSLKNKLGTKAQPGKVARVLRNGSDADIDAVNLFRSLVGDVRISSKTGLTVSPKGANDLIDFANQFTFEKFGESAFWSDELKSELDHLSSLAGNGKFSESQALPVEAMRTINNVLDAINHKLKDNQIAYYERSRAAASDAARGLNFTSASSVTRLGNLVSSAENIPTYFKMYLGEENPAYDVIIRDQVKADGNMLSYQQKYDGELNAIVEGEGMKLKEWDRAMKKKAEFKGAKYTQGELISTYFSAKTKKGIADGVNALTFYDRKGKNYSRRLRLNGEADVKALREAIDPTLLRIAERQQSDVLGGTMTKDFVKQFRLKNGFDPEVSKDYFMLTGDGAAVDISNARNALGSGYTMSNTWRRERSRNSSYKGDYRIVDYRTQLANYANELARYIGYGDYNENIRVLFNTKIDVDGDGHKRSFNDLLREKAPNWAPSSGNKGRSWFNYFQERVTGGSSRNDEGFLGIFTRAGQASVLGLNPRSMAKQFLSDFTVMGDVGFETWLSSKKRVAYNLANYSKVKKFMMGLDETYSPTDPDYAEYEPYFALIRERFLNKGAVKGELSSDAMKTVSGRIADFTMKGMSFFDEANNVINVWSVAETMAKQYNGLAYGTKANKLQAMKYFVDLVLNTQSNNNAFYVSRLRSGYQGSIMRLAFGLFGSDNQNRLQQIDLLIRGKRQANKRRAAYEAVIKNESASKADRELASKMMKSLDANWSGPNYAKRLRGAGVALAANAIGIAVIDQLFDRILAKDDKTFRDGYDEEDALQLLKDAGMNFVNWLPYAGELIDLAVNDYELSVFPLERINTITQTGSEFVRALKSGDRQRIGKAIVDVVKVAGELGGLPLDNVYKYVKGITRNASESAYIYGFRWLEGLTNGQLNAYYNEAIKDKRLTDAKTALSTNYAFYKTGNADERTIKEIARLSSNGYNAVAKNVPDYLTDEEGNQTELSGNQRSAFRSAYSKANGEVRNLVTGYQYQRLSDASKAKAIKRVYDAYYEYARFVITGEAPTSRLGQLLSASRGSFDRIDELATLMGEVGELEADGGESKKDKAMRTVNGYRGLSNAQKLIALALLGYAIPEGSEQSALSYLKSLGLNNAEAKAFLRIE